MITLRPSHERGFFDHGWLRTFHTFSFSNYQDPKHVHFRELRVINEDWVAPGEGFDEHGHQDMEIITVILEGALEHRDSMGNGSIIRPGDVQRMSAGTGVLHSEFNASSSESVHLLQIWMFPRKKGYEPSYDQKHFSLEQRLNRLCLIVSPDGKENSIQMNQDSSIFTSNLTKKSTIEATTGPSKNAWLQLARGGLKINDSLELKAGDGIAISNEEGFKIEALDESEFIYFQLT